MRLCPKIGKYYITRNNPRELLNTIGELSIIIRNLRVENQELKNSINKAVEIIENDWDYDDNDFEARRFQKDILEALGVDYNDRI